MNYPILQTPVSSLAYSPRQAQLRNASSFNFQSSLQDIARSRIGSRLGSLPTRKGRYAAETAVYLPGEVILTKEPLIWNHLAAAAENEGCIAKMGLSRDELKSLLGRDSIRIRGDLEIPTADFIYSPVARWAFGDRAQNYGELLKSCNIKTFSIETSSDPKSGYARMIRMPPLMEARMCANVVPSINVEEVRRNLPNSKKIPTLIA